MKIEYLDFKSETHLEAYADTVVLEREGNTQYIAAIRFGGYPESVKGMSEVIYGGGTVTIEANGTFLTVYSRVKQYRKEFSHDGIYAEANATFVASYGKWRKLGRYVNIGEKGIVIFAPVIREGDNYSEVKIDEDGAEKTIIVEKPLSEISFKKVYVYDISQTSGKEIPSLADELTGDIDDARKEAIFTALRKVTGIDFEFKDISGGAKGYYNSAANRIVIKSGMSDAQTLKTAFHETAHKLLHDPDLAIATVKSPRNEKEIQAESVAFMVSERLGLDTSEYSFPYIASWSDGKELDQLRNCLQEIQDAAKQITAAIEGGTGTGAVR